MERKNVLVTALGTITATSIVQELLSEKENYYIIGADINPAELIVTSKDVDEFYVFPPAVGDQESYREFLLDFCEKHHVDYLFPVIDEEVVDVSAHRAEFEARGVKLCIPNDELIRICHYKNVFAKWLEQNHREHAIRTYDSGHVFGEADFPVFVKPIEGRASNGCSILHSVSELQQMADLDQYIVQEVVEGEIVTVDILRNAPYNQVQMVQRKELLRNKNGCGIAVETILDERIEMLCRALIEQLELNGVINVEFFVTEDTIKVIEINPRFSAGSFFTYMAGCNLAKNMILIAEGMPCELQSVTVGKHYARRYETYEL